MSRKKKYPSNRDIKKAIKNLSFFIGHPSDFPDEVIYFLESEGFKTDFLNYKRIWRLYEEMVRKKEIEDFLNVVKL